MNGTDVKTIYGPISNDTIGDKDGWRAAFEASDRARREGCGDWDATV